MKRLMLVGGLLIPFAAHAQNSSVGAPQSGADTWPPAVETYCPYKSNNYIQFQGCSQNYTACFYFAQNVFSLALSISHSYDKKRSGDEMAQALAMSSDDPQDYYKALTAILDNMENGPFSKMSTKAVAQKVFQDCMTASSQ